MTHSDFFPFTEAAMAALASRSQDWMSWELIEHSNTVEISLLLPRQHGASVVRKSYDPHKDSPSKAVSELLSETSSPLVSNATDLDTEFFRDLQTLKNIRAAKNSQGLSKIY